MEREINLLPEELPTYWYNIVPDLEEYFGGTLPLPKGDIERIQRVLVPECFLQEVSKDSRVLMPEELRNVLLIVRRPRPILRLSNIEKELKVFPGTEIYCKAEFFSPTGSHKLNTALAQVYFAIKGGVKELTTETGAGQWGTACAYAVHLLNQILGSNIRLTVYMVRAAYNRKPERVQFMRDLGAEVFPSPSENTNIGKMMLAKGDPDGSLAAAISEAVEDAEVSANTRYVLGSVLNHVLMHQTIIGLEAKMQLEKIGRYPDIIISCLGGGSNFGGLVLPFVEDVLHRQKRTKFIACQTESAPNLVSGRYRYDWADSARKTLRIKAYTLGHRRKLAPALAEGLRYHLASPIISFLKDKGLIEARAIEESFAFASSRLFFETEGALPPPVVLSQIQSQQDLLKNYNPGKQGKMAPESAYAFAGAMLEALETKQEKKGKIILFEISGHGFLDERVYQEAFEKYNL